MENEWKKTGETPDQITSDTEQQESAELLADTEQQKQPEEQEVQGNPEPESVSQEDAVPEEETQKEKEEDAGPQKEEFKEKAASVYEEIKGEAKERTKNIRKDGKNLLFRMKLVAESFYANPQATLDAVTKEDEHGTAWGFYGLGILLSFLAGLAAEGIGAGIGTAFAAAISALIYPALTCIIANLRRNRVGMGKVMAVFWVKGIPVYILQLLVVILTFLELWPMILIVEVVAFILSMVLNYMATLAISEGDSRDALWTYMIVNVVLIVLLAVLVFMIMLMVIGIFVSGIMHSGGHEFWSIIYRFKEIL